MTIWITVAIDLIGFGIVLPILPLYARRFHTTPWQATLLVAAFSAASSVFSPFWGRVSDRYGPPAHPAGLAGRHRVGQPADGIGRRYWRCS